MNFLSRCFPCILLALGGVLITGCHSGSTAQQETPLSGTIHISVDESFKPVIVFPIGRKADAPSGSAFAGSGVKANAGRLDVSPKETPKLQAGGMGRGLT